MEINKRINKSKSLKNQMIKSKVQILRSSSNNLEIRTLIFHTVLLFSNNELIRFLIPLYIVLWP